MKSISIVLSLLLLIGTFSQDDIPKITIYIESLCPDCLIFITGSLNGFLYYNLTNLVDVTLIPYGNAETVWNEEKQEYEFTCQHGEEECRGNLFETCVIATMEKKKALDTIVCLESKIIITEYTWNMALEDCVTDEEELKASYDCINSKRGNYLLNEMGKQTGEHEYVPYVLINGEHDAVAEREIVVNMLKYVCTLPGNNCDDIFDDTFYAQ